MGRQATPAKRLLTSHFGIWQACSGGLSLEEYHDLLPSVFDRGAQENESPVLHVELPIVPGEKAMLPASLGMWVSIHLSMARQRAIPGTKWLLLRSSAISLSLRI